MAAADDKIRLEARILFIYLFSPGFVP